MCIFELWFSQGISPVLELLGHLVVLFPVLKGILILFSMWNAGLDEAQTGIKIARRNINNLRFADDPYGKKWRTKEPSWGKWKKDKSEKAGFKLNIQKAKIMASGPITSWQIDGETVETMSDFFIWAPKSLQMVIAAMKLKDAYSLEGKLWPT